MIYFSSKFSNVNLNKQNKKAVTNIFNDCYNDSSNRENIGSQIKKALETKVYNVWRSMGFQRQWLLSVIIEEYWMFINHYHVEK